MIAKETIVKKVARLLGLAAAWGGCAGTAGRTCDADPVLPTRATMRPPLLTSMTRGVVPASLGGYGTRWLETTPWLDISSTMNVGLVPDAIPRMRPPLPALMFPPSPFV